MSTDEPLDDQTPGSAGEVAPGPVEDTEVICRWMEPKPAKGPFDFHPWRSISPNGWWVAGASRRTNTPNEWCPRVATRVATLDGLWEVEERLIQMGHADAYRTALVREDAYFWHATSSQKIRALASVIRHTGEGTTT